MSRIQKTFAELKQCGEAALIPFVTAGDPDLATTLKILRALEEGGADCIELGIPFSDPTADGPTIQRASERALKADFLPAIFRLVLNSGVARKCGDSIRLFQSVFSLRLGAFRPASCGRRRRGVLCVDLPPKRAAN